MNSHTRRHFDEILEEVLQSLPPLVGEWIDRVPLHVEDYPPADVMEQVDAKHRDELCGLFTGIALSDRSIEHSGTLPDVVTIYREGILANSKDASGRIPTARLREEMRITVLHELAHFHGLSEDELHDLGYG